MHATTTTMTEPQPTRGAATSNGVRRNPWVERVAHALPYVLFVAAMLLLDSIGRGATQEEFFKSVQNSVNNGPDGGGVTARGFAMFLGIVGLIVAVLVLAQKFQNRARVAKAPSRSASRPASHNQPRKLMKEIAKAAGLSGDEMRQLKAVAEQSGHVSPLTLLICPSLLIDAARKDDMPADKAVLARVVRKIVSR